MLENPTPDRIAHIGIARTFQNIRLFNNLSALENVMIGRHVRTRAGVFGAILRGPGTRAEERAIEKRGHELLEYVGIGERGNELGRGERRVVVALHDCVTGRGQRVEATVRKLTGDEDAGH